MEDQEVFTETIDTPVITTQPEEPVSTPTRRKHVDSKPVPTDSLVSINLSETKRASRTSGNRSSTLFDASDTSFDEALHESRTASLAVVQGLGQDEAPSSVPSSPPTSPMKSPRRSPSPSSEASLQVDWDQLDKAEEREDADAESDEHTTLLLARLEQENAALTADPKSGLKQKIRRQSRPPSVYQLKRLVQEQGARSVRFSLLPTAAPMTELDFWAVLVQDYLQTAQRLPTVTSSKIRAGVPAPLRGVVWASMAGARDPVLEEQYDGLCQLSSPYETIINKDIGRSFPGVAMFREADGEGQRMLASVLKCYSLYDKEIGYCQGLGFLVGPLLMNMGDKQAFCVLVRLMEDYDLRCCFLPNLAGLHLRIYQFQRLLHQHLPELAQHLDHLQVEGAYLSQWFLSFFATTCPLPLLFRIYDVIFAEGASETIMRVALSIMRRNEARLLSFTEFEDAMQLLLGRALWDPYGLSATSADELVSDFVSFTSVVTRESLQALETNFREAKEAEAGGTLSFFPSVQQAATRFLQRRLWAGHTPSKSQPLVVSQTLTPPVPPPSRPHSMLLRTPSKQSLSTIYSTGDSSEGSISTASTSMTEISSMSRESTADQISIKSIKSPTESVERSTGMRATTMSARDRDLHGQIEDLLMALTEMQREHATLAAQLQREREERNEDRLVVRSLVDHLKGEMSQATSKVDRRRTASILEPSTVDIFAQKRLLSDSAVRLVETVDFRFAKSAEHRHNRRSSGFETKQQLRQTNASLREQLRNETMARQSLSRQVQEKEQETSSLRDEIQKARTRIKDGHVDRERLQKTVRDLRQSQRIKLDPRAVSPSRSGSRGSAIDDAPPTSPSIARSESGLTDDSDRAGTTTTSAASTTTGLRQFKLGRPQSAQRATLSTPTQPAGQTPTFSKRSSSLAAATLLQLPDATPPTQPDEALLQELVAAKTAEVVARQELDELKAKFDTMRKMMLGISTPAAAAPGPAALPTPSSISTSLSASPVPDQQPRDRTNISSSAASPPILPSAPLPISTIPPADDKSHRTTTSPDGTPTSGGTGSAKTPASASSGWSGGASSWTGGGFFGWAKRSASVGFGQAVAVEGK